MNSLIHTNTIVNPVIPGFYSDPSICRDNEDYYVVCSSFEFFPGVPVFHSRDLVNWEQISYCLTDPASIPLNNAGTSDGIYAPTLRKHNGLFYMITSNRCCSFGNHFYVTAQTPSGPWSEPIWIRDIYGASIDGVDPSLFFDEDGSVYFCCVAWDENGQGIGQARLDLSVGKLLEPLKIVWHGTGGTFPEGPHTYKINSWYYLMIAEGGTEYGHKVSIARSKRVTGPYENCPSNPILTQNYQYIQSGCIQGVGHGDLFQAHDDTWWMIVHGFRTSVGKLHHLGRETMLVPVKWNEHGWPVVNEHGWISEKTSLQGVFSDVRQNEVTGFFDDFSSQTLRFNYLRNPLPTNYIFGAENGKGLVLTGTPDTLGGEKRPTWLGVRQQHFTCSVCIEMRFQPGEGDEAGFTIFQTAEHHYDLVVAARNGSTVCFLRKTVGDIKWIGDMTVFSAYSFTLSMEASQKEYRFWITADGQKYFIGEGRTQLISTESMLNQNFTGTFLALFAISENKQPTSAYFESFEYHCKSLD